MKETEELKVIKATDLLTETEKLKYEGYRFLVIVCTRVLEGFELTYSFDKEYHVVHLRFTVGLDAKVSSITSLYLPAFVSENEIHDLFGLNITHIAKGVDFHGTFFRLAKKAPWSELPVKGGK
jgi:ech hydrogenase subunit D